MKQSFTKIAICSTLSLGLAVSGVGPVHSVLAQAGSSLVWIDNSPAALPSINEDDANSTGARISDLLSGKVSDPMNAGVAITNLDNAHGNWQYYNASIGLWYNIEPTSDNHVLLLESTDQIRFVPARDWNGDTSVKYKLWDASANGLQKYSYVDSTSYSGFGSDLGSACHSGSARERPALSDRNQRRRLPQFRWQRGLHDLSGFGDVRELLYCRRLPESECLSNMDAIFRFLDWHEQL